MIAWPLRRARRDSVRRGGIASLLVLLGAVLLLAAGVGLAFYIDHSYEAQRLGDLDAQARILAATETAALAFNDRQAAQEYLAALRANPQIFAAGLYTSVGTLFASYPRQASPTLPPVLPAAGVPTSGAGLFNLVVPVRQGDVALGTLILQAPKEPLWARVQRDGAIALLVAMAALLVGVLGVGQIALRRANLALTGRAQELDALNQDLAQQIAQREQAEDALRQAQKMEAVGQLTGGIAHDFNNLLQVVLGSLERLRIRAERMGSGLTPDLDKLVEAALQSARRGATLTRQLLAFSRRQPLEPKPLDVNKLVAGISEMLGRTLGEGLRIETVLAAGLWRVMADQNQLENALLNLAVNARDAMQGGGKLTIETANAHLDEAYARAEHDLVPGQYAMIAVTDTGSGMPPDVLAKVFEPFFTTKGIGRGTGLGLSQVYGFIKQSGGHVKIYSEPGDGTAVKIYLPRLTAGADAASDPEEAREIPRGSPRECVLVVEDEAAVRVLTTATLSDLGYRVLEAADGEQALALLAGTKDVRLLFTDVGLPGAMNGRQLADAARAARPGLKVLFTTGYARNAIVHHGRLDPGVELITKPFPASDLAHRIRALLDGEAVLQQQQ